MIIDKKLEKIEVSSKKEVLWGNYTKEYDWSWTDRPSITPLDNKEASAAVMIRDWNIAKKLHDLGIKRVLDIGSDTGHFIAVLTYYGIEAVGVDTAKECCEEIKSKGINICYQIGIDDLIKISLDSYDCITCMNITHAQWKNEDKKLNFIQWISANTNYAVLSDFTNQDKKWKTLKKIHSFNFLPFRYSPLLEKVFRLLKLEKVVTYSCIQKLYKVI